MEDEDVSIFLQLNDITNDMINAKISPCIFNNVNVIFIFYS